MKLEEAMFQKERLHSSHNSDTLTPDIDKPFLDFEVGASGPMNFSKLLGQTTQIFLSRM